MLHVYLPETLNLRMASTKTTIRYRITTDCQEKNKPQKLKYRFEDAGFIHHITVPSWWSFLKQVFISNSWKLKLTDIRTSPKACTQSKFIFYRSICLRTEGKPVVQLLALHTLKGVKSALLTEQLSKPVRFNQNTKKVEESSKWGWDRAQEWR